MLTDLERIDALLDLVDPGRGVGEGRGPELAVFGLAVGRSRRGYEPTTAGWALLGDRGRAFRRRH